MARYLIEARHDAAPNACLRVLDAFLQAGSHYLRNAEWGCEAGEHTAWIIVDAHSDEDARLMAPPIIRNSALIVKLNRFTPEQIEQLHKEPD